MYLKTECIKMFLIRITHLTSSCWQNFWLLRSCHQSTTDAIRLEGGDLETGSIERYSQTKYLFPVRKVHWQGANKRFCLAEYLLLQINIVIGNLVQGADLKW